MKVKNIVKFHIFILFSDYYFVSSPNRNRKSPMCFDSLDIFISKNAIYAVVYKTFYFHPFSWFFFNEYTIYIYLQNLSKLGLFQVYFTRVLGFPNYCKICLIFIPKSTFGIIIKEYLIIEKTYFMKHWKKAYVQSKVIFKNVSSSISH